MVVWILTCGALVCSGGSVGAQERFAGIDVLNTVIEQAIADEQIPGAVLLVRHKGKTIHRKAYGARAVARGKRLGGAPIHIGARCYLPASGHFR